MSAALTVAGEVWAWGGGFNGELGSPSLSWSPGPRRVDGILAQASPEAAGGQGSKGGSMLMMWWCCRPACADRHALGCWLPRGTGRGGQPVLGTRAAAWRAP